MARWQHSGGGRYRPRDVTGGMRAAIAAQEVVEKVLRNRAAVPVPAVPAKEPPAKSNNTDAKKECAG